MFTAESADQRVDVSARRVVAIGPPQADVEKLLAEALAKAAEARRWDIVAQLARELEARRRIVVDVPCCDQNGRRDPEP
jgi:hypothetical protein